MMTICQEAHRRPHQLKAGPLKRAHQRSLGGPAARPQCAHAKPPQTDFQTNSPAAATDSAL
ncbi:hypothetical protein BH20VER1_BH20VER1_08510 [soil metagenome]